jgi:hypothetical protein
MIYKKVFIGKKQQLPNYIHRRRPKGRRSECKKAKSFMTHTEKV